MDKDSSTDGLTREQINLWSSGYRAGVKRVIELVENELGHRLEWTREITERIEPKPEPEPDPPADQ